jgi:hypothetical protein
MLSLLAGINHTLPSAIALLSVLEQPHGRNLDTSPRVAKNSEQENCRTEAPHLVQ